MLRTAGAPALRLRAFAKAHAATGAVALLSEFSVQTHTLACFRQGVWCVPHYEESRCALSRRSFSLVHLRAFRAGCEHRLVSWCTCSGTASVAEVLFSNQVRIDVHRLSPCALLQCVLFLL